VCDLGSTVDRSERVLLRADGTRMPILKSVKRTRMDGREKLLECFLDLTERNRAEAERQQLQDRLRHAEKMESVGALAGGVAHDMNNVLAAILASAERLEEILSAWPQAARAVQTILHAGARGRDLVQSLTTFAHRDPPMTRPVDLNDLVASEADLLSRTTLQRVQLVLDLEPGLPEVLADPSSLANAVMNLSINSLDAMEQGGILTFRTRFQGDGRVLLEVADTGHGMSPEVLAKAMDPFFTTKPKGKGTGLGLARVYGTVQALGGKVLLSSRPGEGTTASLLLPAAQYAKDPAPAAPAVVANVPERQAILVVDDDVLVQDSVRALLEARGHTVTVAASGADALACLESGLKPDLVVMDERMPGLTGHQTALRLRGAYPRLPVVLTTGYLDPATAEILGAVPRLRVLLKPYLFPQLLAAWEELLA
jgi:signal transduction histidine kinase/CheY-like chemotaxis protein